MPASEANTKNWDISFKRIEIQLNGGISGPGNTVAIVITDQSYDGIEIPPEDGYIKEGEGPNDVSGLDLTNKLALTNWFDYSNEQHSVLPKDQVYVIRTSSNNKYAKLQILSYYFESSPPISASYSFKYTLQPGGSKVLK